MKQERLIYMDILRILACFSVIMLHSAAQFWYDLPVKSLDWLIVNSYNAIVRFGVPIFAAISGALFLSSPKQISLKRLYVHNILRIVILYFLWSAIYGLYDCRKFNWSMITLNDVLIEIYAGRYHLWYLPMIIALYMLIPVFKKWVDNAEKREVQYLLLVFLIFTIGKNTVMSLIQSELMGFAWKVFEVEQLLGYIGYFVLGYYMVHYGINVKWHKWVYVGGIIGACANIVLSGYKTLRTGVPDGVIFDSFGFFTFLMVLALLLFFVEKVSKMQLSQRANDIVKEISTCTLGIYLMHLVWLEFLQEKGIHSMMVPPIIGVPLAAIICFVICFLCSAILRRIPLVGKYIC